MNKEKSLASFINCTLITSKYAPTESVSLKIHRLYFLQRINHPRQSWSGYDAKLQLLARL